MSPKPSGSRAPVGPDGPHYGGFVAKPGGGYTTPGGHDIPHEEMNKPWYDIRGDKKKELLAAGGLAVGLGLLGGAVYMNHQKHEKEDQEQREAQAWELQNWVMNAKRHSDQFIREGPQGPFTWILVDSFVEHPNLLQKLVQGGQEDGQPWFIARAPYHGSLQIGRGRLQPEHDYAFVGYGGEAIEVKKFELLIANPGSTHWVRVRGKFDPNSIREQAIKGGHEKDGPELYIAHVWHNNAMYPGKCGPSVHGGAFCYHDKEIASDDYEVLCFRE